MVYPCIYVSSLYEITPLLFLGCEIGSKKSETDSFFEKKSLSSQTDLYLDSPNSSNDQSKLMSTSSGSSSRITIKSRKNDTKISDMSSDSIIWLSHR